MTRGLETTSMPSNLKKTVRVRMAKTGESYEQALRHVRAQEQRPRADRAEAGRSVSPTPPGGTVAEHDVPGPDRGLPPSPGLPASAIAILYIGDRLTSAAQHQVSTFVRACLDRQGYAPGTEARVFVERRGDTYNIEARAREPDGPVVRLADLQLPLDGARPEDFEAFMASNGLDRVEAESPLLVGARLRDGRKVGRNERCPCGSGRKYKQCCN